MTTNDNNYPAYPFGIDYIDYTLSADPAGDPMFDAFNHSGLKEMFDLDRKGLIKINWVYAFNPLGSEEDDTDYLEIYRA